MIEGDPAEVRRSLAAYAEAGVDRSNVEFRVRETERFLEQVEHFAREFLAPQPPDQPR